MAEVIVSNITALLGGIVPIIILRFTSNIGAKDFRVIVSIGAIVLIGVGLQYAILFESKPTARSEAAIPSGLPDKTPGAPLPDDAEFHLPTWHYSYNDGYSYVEGYSEVVLNGNVPDYQYRARIQCSEPQTLYVSLLEGYYDYSFLTENSPHGSVTRITIYIDGHLQIVAEKVRVADDSAIIPFANLVEKLSEGVLLRVNLSAQVKEFDWNPFHSVIFDLDLFEWNWRDCSP